jgi:hypothetical protein
MRIGAPFVCPPTFKHLAHVANLFPDMTIADLSAAMQEAMAEVARQATRRH